MAHTISERRMQQRIKEFAGDKIAAEQRAHKREVLHNRRIVTLWNKRAARGSRPSFYPTIETMISAGTPWLQVQCPACQCVGEVDIRKLDRHPQASIDTLIPALSCQACCPNAPFAKLIGLTKEPTIVIARSESFEVMAKAKREHR